ncbi:MAG: hypothetical protein IK005_03265 [Paludibacteraceae bacterium]|nr:hypothetical protein [Paludibacteraceae bacterium]MBR4839481.1 hypothetical protein [Paludibacteraceae bacterium]
MRNRLFQLGICALLTIIFSVDVELLSNSHVDGKSRIEPFGTDVAEIYYMRVDSLAIAMFINFGLVVILVFLLNKMNEKNKKKCR